MEYADKKIFDVRYNDKKNCIETNQKGGFIKNHKFLSTTIGATIVLMGINCYLIYVFFNTLSLMIS